MKRKIGVLILYAVAAAALSVTLLGCGGGAADSGDQQEDQTATSEQTADADHSAEIKALAELIPKEARTCAEKRLKKLPKQFAGSKRYKISDDIFYATPYVICVPGAVQYAEYNFPVVDNETGSVAMVIRVTWGEDGCESTADIADVKMLNKVDYADSPSLFYLGDDPTGEDITLIADNGVTFTELRGSADNEMRAFEEKPFEERLLAVKNYIKSMKLEPMRFGAKS